MEREDGRKGVGEIRREVPRRECGVIVPCDRRQSSSYKMYCARRSVVGNFVARIQVSVTSLKGDFETTCTKLCFARE